MKPLTRTELKVLPYRLSLEALPTRLVLLACYAAQAPKFDPADYGPGNGRAYMRDRQRVYRQLDVVAMAIDKAVNAGVDNADLLRAAEHCGRVKFVSSKIGEIVKYTPGQYWSVEYRQAVIGVLERAAADKIAAIYQ